MLHTGAPLSLQANYLHHLVYLETCQKLEEIKKSGTCPAGVRTPTSMDVILLFIGKKTWYNSYLYFLFWLWPPFVPISYHLASFMPLGHTIVLLYIKSYVLLLQF